MLCAKVSVSRFSRAANHPSPLTRFPGRAPAYGVCAEAASAPLPPTKLCLEGGRAGQKSGSRKRPNCSLSSAPAGAGAASSSLTRLACSSFAVALPRNPLRRSPKTQTTSTGVTGAPLDRRSTSALYLDKARAQNPFVSDNGLSACPPPCTKAACTANHSEQE